MSLILGIDTSCDETSCAILADENQLLSNIISSQIKLHRPHGGVVPELASRSHLENISIVVEVALEKANITAKDLTGIAVTTSPGLIGCLLVGLSFAKAYAYNLKIPLTCVHHLKGHLFSPFLEKEEEYPFLSLVVSGGHTTLYYVKNFNDVQILGQTVDDAAGEAYDKTAKLLGLGYPGGPILDQLARKGNPNTYKFTRARVKRGPFYFSFSGLKTAVSLLVKKEKVPLTDSFVCNLAASFQKEVSEALIEKVELALKEYPARAFFVSGGVAVNSAVRIKAKELSQKLAVDYFIPSPVLCTDNGAMIAYVGAKQLKNGLKADLSANAFASKAIW